MGLTTYRQKRDFKATSEPRGGRAAQKGSSFVIQKHDATRLHYDLRLEMNGVLKSWAVTKGPSLVPGEKRLAVHVEDHPLEYGDFEGTIPKGEYGGGTVIVWDRGTWTPVDDAERGYAKGHLEFELEGSKLRGRWHLVRMRGKPREKRENWLLIKGDDDAARSPTDPDILVEAPRSAKTGRDIAEVAGESPGWSSRTGAVKATPRRRTKDKPGVAVASPAAQVKSGVPAVKGAKKAPMPAFLEPTLATLVTSPPSGERWIHEIKFDGYRLQARLEATRVKLLTRSGLDWTTKFGMPLVTALRSLPLGNAIIDGEVVVENDAGASDFSLLQSDLSEGRTDRFALYAFDLLYLDGFDLTTVPLAERKSLLEATLTEGAQPLLRYSAHFSESGALVMNHACRLSLEGIISKVSDSLYQPGRAKAWTKSKCSARQEFVIAGYVPSTTSRRAIGSLVLGVNSAGLLEHVGRVGTGFTATVAEQLFERLERLRMSGSPFSGRLTAEESRQVRFVRPDLVAEVEFRAWTGDGHLRHASFRGIREDKAASEIIREAPPAGGRPAPKLAGRGVKLTHPDRVYWPDKGVTKEGLADYYTEVWRHIAPHIVGRPLALLRCPTGISGERFFQKHAWKGIDKNIRLMPDPTEPGSEPLLSIDSLDGLIGLVQNAALEIHPWGSTMSDWEHPDRIVMDLDPGEGVPWTKVIAGALEVRSRLERYGLAAYVKTSGGKGLHVVAPLLPGADWPAVKAFAKSIADAMASDNPQGFVATITKSKRNGKILIDYLRNQRGATAVAAFSTRAREGAAVSAPLHWDELTPEIGPAFYTIDTMPTRLATLKTDPWRDFSRAAMPLDVGKTRPRAR